MKRKILFLALSLFALSLAGCKEGAQEEKVEKENYLSYNLPKPGEFEGRNLPHHRTFTTTTNLIPDGYTPFGKADNPNFMPIVSNDGLVGYFNTIQNDWIVNPFIDARTFGNEAHFEIVFNEPEVITLGLIHYGEKDLIIDQYGNIFFEGTLKDSSRIKVEIDLLDGDKFGHLLVMFSSDISLFKPTFYVYDEHNVMHDLGKSIENKDFKEYGNYLDIDLAKRGHPGYSVKGFINGRLQVINDKSEVENEYYLNVDMRHTESYAVVGDSILIQEINELADIKDDFNMYDGGDIYKVKSYKINLFTGERTEVNNDKLIINEQVSSWVDKNGEEAYGLIKGSYLNTKDLDSSTWSTYLINSDYEILEDYKGLEYEDLINLGNFYYNPEVEAVYDKDFNMVTSLDDEYDVEFVAPNGKYAVLEDAGDYYVFDETGKPKQEFLGYDLIAASIGASEIWFANTFDDIEVYDVETLTLKETFKNVQDFDRFARYNEFGFDKGVSVYRIEGNTYNLIADLDGNRFYNESLYNESEIFDYLECQTNGYLAFAGINELNMSRVEFLRCSYLDVKVRTYTWDLGEEATRSDATGTSVTDSIKLTLGKQTLKQSENNLHYSFKSDETVLLDLTTLAGKIVTIQDDSLFMWSSKDYIEFDGTFLALKGTTYDFIVDTTEGDLDVDIQIITRAEEYAEQTENIALVEGKTPYIVKETVIKETGIYKNESTATTSGNFIFEPASRSVAYLTPLTDAAKNKAYRFAAGQTIYTLFIPQTEAYDIKPFEKATFDFGLAEGETFLVSNDATKPWLYDKESNTYIANNHEVGQGTSLKFGFASKGTFTFTVKTGFVSGDLVVKFNHYAFRGGKGIRTFTFEVNPFDVIDISFRNNSGVNAMGQDTVAVLNPVFSEIA